MNTVRAQPRQRGVSLIEALVALAVMAIGMLGLVGVQSTLRGTSDVSKQRSEAVRIAQVQIEEMRGFPTLGDYQSDWPEGETSETEAGTNATYTRTVAVTDLAAPRVGKTMQVTVAWVDRNGVAQSVQLSSLMAGIEPALTGTLAIPGDGDVVRRPHGRQRGVPPLAKELGGGKSGMVPPGTTGQAWIFDNLTGVVDLCSTSAAATADLVFDDDAATTDNVWGCSGKAILVGGFVRYALGDPPDAGSLSPPSTPPAASTIQVWALYGGGSEVACAIEHVDAAPYYSAYYCAVPVVVVPGVAPAWSGSLQLRPTSLLATTNASDKLRACRYPATPASYTLQGDPLLNQNFVLIRAGDGIVGSTPYACPTPTLLHQPVP